MRRKHPNFRACTHSTAQLLAALDAGDPAAVVAALRARPECPSIDWSDVFPTSVALGDTARPVHLGYIGLGPECPSCQAVARLLHEHPIMAADSPERRAILAELDWRRWAGLQ